LKPARSNPKNPPLAGLFPSSVSRALRRITQLVERRSGELEMHIIARNCQKNVKMKKSLVIDAGIGFTRASEVPWIFLKPRINIGETSGKTMKKR